ncbi:predicted protein [Aspergillus nidulans FGSC A4]|uniref:Uncharacterized protein n=1 Tax=Emericella nidulans (strain FGSC A4 / ATCC 38163 / CBS 112.46 / NRRL 194 / M139) TaxID=227321 RepID=Q5B5I9_EMENI|nr:hypothetical protein [Aspergillus nidulans FGSC A4]EAA59290.1 predicted protein [Aspergillus nidulans FGSC A4]CBF74518.1 TPA: hypothetical protein ANIA_04191 [Aspergillus nidulans FGSC A4]|eukprot:XP_661795.1 predicted protein [Aspergillus nidulans FGSC A4]
MDLSSLEGPPIADTRFSNVAQGAVSIPQIQFDTTLSPLLAKHASQHHRTKLPHASKPVHERKTVPKQFTPHHYPGVLISIFPSSLKQPRTNTTLAPPERSHSSMSSLGPSRGMASISHFQPMNNYNSTDLLADTHSDDVPPPYEQHVFDQPLGPILPAVTRVNHEESPQRGSRWTAIGRRVT